MIYASLDRQRLGPIEYAVYTNVTSKSWSVLNVHAKCAIIALENGSEDSFLCNIK